MTSNTSILSLAPFSEMQQWDVKQFISIQITSQYPVEKLGLHLIQHTEKINPSDFPDDDFSILGVSNKIGMFDAYVEKGNRISQKYTIVENDWIAYNPYRVNVGSIGLKTSDLHGKYISPAYVVFSCKDTLLPEFLLMMMKSEVFNSLIRNSTTGSVRQTLGFEKLAKIMAPIPPVSEQQKILDAYHKTIDLANRQRVKGEDIEFNLLDNIQSDVSNLNSQLLNQRENSGLLCVVPFVLTKRWEVEYIYKEWQLDYIYGTFKYKDYRIDDLKTDSLFGLSEKASKNKNREMIPVLRMSNIVNGELDLSELKYLPKKSAGNPNDPERWLLKPGDLLITRTNGSKDLVGKSAMFNIDGTFTYASYVIRYRFNTSLVLPEYVNIMFMTSLVRGQIAVMRRQGGGQYNLNSDEIGSIRIPVPSISDQKKIINKFNAAKNQIQKLYQNADTLKKKGRFDFDKTVFHSIEEFSLGNNL